MKKNISINISGIIFHIEEDGYENLKKYLDSINKYFSSFEDSSEILADIESRIAEIFLSKLNEEKQVITSDDVNALVTTMGSVSDFKAAEEEEDFPKKAASTQQEAQPESEQTSSTSSGASSSSSSSGKTYTAPKSLARDQKRKILGGVCSGIANYMNVDAVWIRLLFALLTFAYGITVIIYAIMWIAVPGSYDLEEPEVEKKLFRDAQRKVIGGVSGGVAAFLGIDIVAVRVLFILFTLAGGLGLFVYIVMWIILPEARSLTDKMQMQGEPVTLSNIESSYKKSQDERGQEETTATKILMFPFRVIGIILTALAKIIVPILEVIRVAIGIFIVIFGVGFLFATFVAGGVSIGVFSEAAFPWAEHNEMNIPLEAITRIVPGWVVAAAFFASLAPSLFVVLLGVSVIAKRIVFNAAVGWSLFAIFFISIALLGVGIPKIAYGFKEDGEYKIETTYQPTSKRAVLKINEVGMDDFNGASLTLKGYIGKELKLVQNFSSRGSTRQKAIENAQMIEYHVEAQDSILTFDSNVTFKPEAIFREQRVDMDLFIPYNYPFTMDEGMCRFIRQYINYEDMDSKTWQIDEERGLECLNCSQTPEQREISQLRDFNELEITGKFDMRIVRGHNFSVEIDGTEKEKDRYEIYKVGETLVIEYEDRKKFDFDLNDLNVDEVRITITMPWLERLEATGWGSIRFDEFDSDDLDISISGPVKINGDVNTQKLTISLTGKAEADIGGRANSLNAMLELASKLKAYNLDVVDAVIETNMGSSAKVSVSGTLEMEEGAASNIDYRGNPRVIKRD